MSRSFEMREYNDNDDADYDEYIDDDDDVKVTIILQNQCQR